MDVLTLVLSILLGLVILTILVAVHEFGHGLVARRYKVIVQEFGIGFPPRAKGKKVKKSLLGKDVLYTLNWLPLGGFVKLQGEHDSDTGKGDYGAATFWQKTQVLLAGVAMNWLMAAVLLTGLSLFGIPRVLPDQFTVASDTKVVQKPVEIVTVQSGSPAEKAGLTSGDVLLSLDGESLEKTEQFIDKTADKQGQQITINYQRDGQDKQATATLRSDEGKAADEGYLGASLAQQESLRATWSAPIVGVGLTGQMTVVTLQGLGDTLLNLGKGLVQKFSLDEQTRQQGSDNIGQAGANVAGPVGLIGSILPRLIEAGPAHIILVSAIISLSLAVLNALPIPALDGGRWFLTALFRVLRRPLTPEREEMVNGIGFLLLMGLFVLITIADIGKF